MQTQSWPAHVVVLLIGLPPRLPASRPDCLHREQETGPCNEAPHYDSGTTHTFDRNRSWQTSLAGVVHLVRPLAPPTSSAESWVISRKQPWFLVDLRRSNGITAGQRTGSIPGSSTTE
jgi:hypothetical protein